MARVAGHHISMGGADSWLAHSDAVDSTTLVTDQTGAVVYETEFGPWGRTLRSGGPRPWGVFAGLRWPVNDPLQPSATREYSSSLGRWMTPDPDNAGSALGDSQSWNMYSYVGDNPITRTDPSGLDCLYLSSQSTSSIDVGVERGACSGSGGIYVNGTVDVNSLKYNGSELGYSYAPYSGGSGTGVIGLGAPASTSDLSPFALEALPLTGQWASTGIRNAAINMGINGALVGVGVLLRAGVDALAASGETAGTARSAAQALPNLDGLSRQAAKETLERNGFKLWRPNPGGYERWNNPDGSRVWIGPDGVVDRIPPGMSGKGWRATPEGTVRRPHTFPEERVN